MEEQIYSELHRIFHGGDRVTNKKLKETIQALYNRFGYNSYKAKGTDIKKYGFSTKRCKIKTEDGRIDGVELSIVR